METSHAQSRARGGGWTRPIRRLRDRLRDGDRLPWLVALPLIIGVSIVLWAGLILSLRLIF